MASSTDMESPSKMEFFSRQGSNITANRSSTASFGTFMNTPDMEAEAERQAALESALLPDLTTDNDSYLRAKAYTPDELLDMPPNRPDISIFCTDCVRYVDLRLMTEHKAFHRALDTMKYKGKLRPESVPDLMKRRRAVLRRMKKLSSPDKPILPSEIHKVNDAYEFLKADIQDTFEVYRRVVEHNSPVDAQGVALNCSPNCITAVGICCSGNERWKSNMEDTRVFQDYFGNDQHKAFFGIYDGHNGRYAAEIAANELHHAILSEMEKFDPRTKCTCTYNMADSYDISQYEIHSRPQSGLTLSERGVIHEQSTNVIHQIIRTCEEKMAEIEQQQQGQTGKKAKVSKKTKEKEPFAEKLGDAFVKAHKYTDILLSWGKDERSKVRWSGCSTLNAVIQDTPQEPGVEENKENEGKDVKRGPPTLRQLGTIHLANAGNVRGLLVRGNQHYKLSRDHTPANSREYKRVTKEGGSVNESDRVLLVNGILNATRGLGNHGDTALKKCVITEPYTCSVAIDQFAQFLILASNGLWEMFSDEEVAKLALQLLPENQVPVSSVTQSVLRLVEKSQSPDSARQSDGSSLIQAGGGLDDSTTDANDLRRKTATSSRPRASTAQSRASVTIAEEAHIINPQDQDEEELLNIVSSSEFVNIVTVEKKNAKNKSPPQKNGLLPPDFLEDLRTEVGSHIDNYSDESGNEGDIDTTTEGLSIVTDLANHVPTREEIQREFAKSISERLVQASLLAGAKDNITVMVILFPGAGI